MLQSFNTKDLTIVKNKVLILKIKSYIWHALYQIEDEPSTEESQVDVSHADIINSSFEDLGKLFHSQGQ